MFLSVLSSLCFVSISQDVAEGEQIFKNVCKACHNLPGGGMSTGPDLKDVLNSDLLKKLKIINKNSSKLKILGTGEIKDKINIEANLASKSAVTKLEKIGGSIQLKK